MESSFYFYDLETSGFNPRSSRIMQFAGMRTDLNLQSLNNEINELIQLPKDVLPDPGAILLTKITPQVTLENGYTEAEFLKQFNEQALKPNTILVGYNNVRFDDEFIRFLNYRNFYDAYEWQWKDGRSRWDLLDLVRMTRALRPEGINWPVIDGKPNNQLENLSVANNLQHDSAHDAMSDVVATIAVAKLIKDKQPKLFNFLLNLRHKREVKKLVESSSPFVYTSSHFPSDILHTTVVLTLTISANDSSLVYDLRHDPTKYLEMSVEELIEAWRYKKDSDEPRLPVKTIKYNRVPAIAPLSVINNEATKERLNLNFEEINKNKAILEAKIKDFAIKMLKVVEQMDKTREEERKTKPAKTVDEKLYDGFIDRQDVPLMQRVRKDGSNIETNAFNFKDKRLKELLPLYKARNFPKSLTGGERSIWEEHIKNKLTGGVNSELASFYENIKEYRTTNTSKQDQYILEELELYAQSIVQDLVSENEDH